MTQTSRSFELQNDLDAFVSYGDTYLDGAPVEVVQTRGAIILLTGNVAPKIKPTVRSG